MNMDPLHTEIWMYERQNLLLKEGDESAGPIPQRSRLTILRNSVWIYMGIYELAVITLC
jgi:hypothetical protein